MKVCYFGDLDPEYNRNRVLIRGLQSAGCDVLLCVTKKRGFDGFRDLYALHKNLKNSYDILLIGYSDSRYLVPLAWLLSSKKVVWDAFYSRYDTIINDRKLASQFGIKALYYWLTDWLSCKLSDHILLDTQAHVDYFRETFGVKEGKCTHVFVGADDRMFKNEV